MFEVRVFLRAWSYCRISDFYSCESVQYLPVPGVLSPFPPACLSGSVDLFHLTPFYLSWRTDDRCQRSRGRLIALHLTLVPIIAECSTGLLPAGRHCLAPAIWTLNSAACRPIIITPRKPCFTTSITVLRTSVHSRPYSIPEEAGLLVQRTKDDSEVLKQGYQPICSWQSSSSVYDLGIR